MSALELSAEQIKIIFASRARRFYFLNLFVFFVAITTLIVFQDKAFYLWIFIGTVFALLLWIFNADRLCLCPACGEVPRGKEGLIAKPSVCAHCGVALK